MTHLIVSAETTIGGQWRNKKLENWETNRRKKWKLSYWLREFQRYFCADNFFSLGHQLRTSWNQRSGSFHPATFFQPKSRMWNCDSGGSVIVTATYSRFHTSTKRKRTERNAWRPWGGGARHTRHSVLLIPEIKQPRGKKFSIFVFREHWVNVHGIPSWIDRGNTFASVAKNCFRFLWTNEWSFTFTHTIIAMT